MKTNDVRSRFALCIALGLAAGCSAAPDTEAPATDGTNPAAPAPESSDVRMEDPDAKKLLASIHHSDTHVIEFWEHELGVIQIGETLNIDRDLVPGRIMLSQADIEGKSLADAYRLLAGSRGESDVLAKLAEVDARIGPRVAVGAERGDARSSPDDAMTLGDAPLAPDPARGAPFRTLGSTQCQNIADGWDWNADIAWFKNNFCRNDSVACFANAPNTWVGYTAWYKNQNSWFSASGFEGSHCDTAVFTFSLKLEACNGGIVNYPFSATMNPRTGSAQNWSTSGCVRRADWSTRVTGNWSGQDYQRRLGLAVHRK